MLELIVLGNVPGTTFRITFAQVLLSAVLFLVLSLFIHETKNSKQKMDELKKFVALLSLRRPEQSTERTA